MQRCAGKICYTNVWCAPHCKNALSFFGSENKRASLYCLQDSEEKLFFISQEIASCETKGLRQGAHCPVDNGFTPTETAQLAEKKQIPFGYTRMLCSKIEETPFGYTRMLYSKIEETVTAACSHAEQKLCCQSSGPRGVRGTRLLYDIIIICGESPKIYFLFLGFSRCDSGISSESSSEDSSWRPIYWGVCGC